MMAAKMAAASQFALVNTLISYLSPDFFQISYMDHFHQVFSQDRDHLSMTIIFRDVFVG